MNPLLIQAGITGGGILAGKLFGNKPKPSLPEVPDLDSAVTTQFDQARRSVREETDLTAQDIQTEASAAGVNPIAAMADLARGSSSAFAGLEADRVSAVTDAQNQEKMLNFQRDSQLAGMQYQQDMNSYLSRMQGIGSVASGVGQYFTNRNFLKQLKKIQEEGGDGQGNPLAALAAMAAQYQGMPH